MTKRIVLLTVLIISALTLQLEFVQTRIFSFALWNHFVYIVITMALLGFAISGTCLSISSRLKRLTDAKFFVFCLLGFSFSSFFASRFAFLPVNNIFCISPSPKIIFGLITAYTLAMVPYFFAGLTIGGSFIRFPRITGTLYFFNLLGSGLGCLLFITLISPIGAPRLLIMTSLFVLAPLLTILKIKRDRLLLLIIIPWFIFLVMGLLLREDSKLHYIKPDSNKQFNTLLKQYTKLEYTEWNPISRVDVISHAEHPTMKFILYDGDALAMFFNTALVNYLINDTRSPFALISRDTIYELLGRSPERSLIIGSGGGVDVLHAALRNARYIDAVEINPTTVRLTSQKYSSQIDNVFSAPNIKLFNEDGRSFVRKTKQKYDTIMMCGTDSLHALATGAYVLLDNYLYTKEAFVDYLNCLSDAGFIQIKRWSYPEKPREELRVFATAWEACRTVGIKDPVPNIVAVLESSDQSSVQSMSIIFKKTPFTQEELGKLDQFCAQYGYQVVFSKDIYNASITMNELSPFVELAKNFKNGTEREFYNRYPYKVAPVSDDSPFFYQYNRWHQRFDSKSLYDYFDSVRGIWHIFVLSSLLIHAVVLSFLFVLLPFIICKTKLSDINTNLFTVTFFSLIGVSFMLLEMGIMQKFVLFLGNPIYSMSVVIPTLLIGAGLGSLFSERIKKNIAKFIFAAVLINGLMILFVASLIPSVSKLFLIAPISIRIIIVMITMFPLAFCMGFPFPLAIRIISSKSQALVSWAWAINGSASVIASIVAIIMAMELGFNMVLITSAVGYIIAGLTVLFFLRRKMM